MTRSADGDVDVVVLTALALEYDAVHPHLADPREYVDADGTRYAIGRVGSSACRVALAVIGAGNMAAAALTGRAIDEFRPQALLLVGIAGGLAHDVDLGDVVVATHVYAYQGGRAEPERLRVRPRGWPLAHRLEQIARGVARTGSWEAAAEARVHFKPMVSGDLVLDTRTGPVAELIAENFADAVAIDMESAGVAEAALRKDFYRAVTVRGVSDAAGGHKRHTDAAGWQPRAAGRAAAFAVALAERIVRPVPATPPERPSDTGPCPYPGLAAFGEQDADLFFGRDRVAGELAELVGRRRFVAVAGPSGSGKSSLLRAGLLPRLRAHDWAITELRPLPGVPAAKTLGAALAALPGGERGRRRHDRDQPLTDLISQVLTESGATRLLICVDQFEELDRASAQDVAGLVAGLAAGVQPVHVILTMRTETLDLAAGSLGLGDLARTSVFLLPPMHPEELRAAVEAPAAPTGVTFQPGLVDRITAAAGDSPGALPLIQFALTRLWEEAHGPVLTHDVYAGFGGVEGALAGYAERVWSGQLDDAERARARRLFLQMTRPVEGGAAVRRTARAAELGSDLLPLARRLATTRLVVEGVDAAGEPVYDLAHAALATHWRRLRGWLAEEHEFRIWQEDLRGSIRRAEPLRGARLAAARRWLRAHPDGVSGAERAFVRASGRRDRRRLLAWRGGAALVLVLALVASALAAVLADRTRDLAGQLRRNAAQALIGRADELARTDPETSALMAVAAYRTSPDPSVQARLAGDFARLRSTTALLATDASYLRDVRISADGRVIAALGDGRARVWRLDGARPVPTELEGELTAIELSADGRTVAGVNRSGQVVVWWPDGGSTAFGRPPPMPAFGTPRLRFDGAGRRLFAQVPGTGPVVWDLGSRTAVGVPDGAARQMDAGAQVWFGPGGRSLVVDGRGALTLWPLDAGERVELPDPGPGRAAVAGDGRTVYVCARGALVDWDLVQRRERRRAQPPGGRCPELSGMRLGASGPMLAGDPLDHTGEVLLTLDGVEGGDRHPRVRVSMVDLAAGTAAHPVLPMSGAVLAYDVAATGDTVRVAATVGSSVAVLDLPRTALTALDEGSRPAFASGPLLGPGRWAAATTLSPARLSIWDTETGEPVTDLANRDNEQPQRFTVDGRRLVTRAAAARLVVREVPGLRALATLRLPVAPGIRPANAYEPYHGLCVDGTADPDVVAVVFGGFASRFDLRTGHQLGEVRLWTDEADLARLAATEACAVRPGRDEIAFNTADGVEVWSLTERRRVATHPVGRPTAVESVEFSPDGRHLAGLGVDGVLDVWDRERPEAAARSLTVLPTGLFYPGIVAFPAADRIVVRIAGGLRIWDLSRGALTANVDVDSGIVEPVLAADGRTVLVWMWSAGLMRLPLEPDRWAEHLCRAAGRDLTGQERRSLPPGSATGPICGP